MEHLEISTACLKLGAAVISIECYSLSFNPRASPQNFSARSTRSAPVASWRSSSGMSLSLSREIAMKTGGPLNWWPALPISTVISDNNCNRLEKYLPLMEFRRCRLHIDPPGSDASIFQTLGIGGDGYSPGTKHFIHLW